MPRSRQTLPAPVDQPIPLSEVIQAVAERIHYAEGRRTNFTVVAGALLAGGIAILTFILDKHLGKHVTYPAVVAATASIALGIVLLIAYARQTNRYPWTSATQTWKWFYRDALPNEKEFNPKWWSFFWFGPEKRRLQKAYTTQLPLFSSKIDALSDPKVSLDQDIQQLYVLHINEKFKNLHLSQLRTIFQRGLILLAVLTIIAAYCGVAADKERLKPRNISEVAGEQRIDANWHFVSASDDVQTVFVLATVENVGAVAIDPPSWLFRDGEGTSIPATIIASTDAVSKIPPKTKVTYSIFLKPAENVPVENIIAKLR